MADKTNTPLGMAALRALSRTSGPATVYTMAEDGTIASVHQRPARDVWKAGRLNARQMVALLRETGRIPDSLPPEAFVGVQKADNRTYTNGDARMEAEIKREMARTGAMYGFVDPTGQVGGHGDPMRNTGGSIRVDNS